MTFTKTLLAAALFAGATAAQATDINPDSLFLSVYDSVHAQTYDLNLDGVLGLNYDAMLTKSSFSVDLSQDANWTAFAGTNDANINATSTSFGIADASTTAPAYQYLTRNATSLTQTSAAISNNSSSVGLMPGRIILSEGGLGTDTTLAHNSAVVVDANADQGGWALAPGVAETFDNIWADVIGINASVKYGNTGNFFELAAATVKNGPVTNYKLGTFSLVGNTLTYTQATTSAVPLPTAVWMFGAGLMAMLGANRRKAV